MGTCASHAMTKTQKGSHEWPPCMPPSSSTVSLVHVDGRLQQFSADQPIRASEILTQHPDSFLCCSESMVIGSTVPQIHGDEELQLGHIYFLLPVSDSGNALSLQELCALAIKASAALQSKFEYSAALVPGNKSFKTRSYRSRFQVLAR